MKIFVGACKEYFEKQLDVDNAFNIKRIVTRHEVFFFVFKSKFKNLFPLYHITRYFTLKCLFPAIWSVLSYLICK